MGVSERTLTRRFVHATGLTSLRFEHAESLIAQESGVESAARAVGFEGARMLRRLRSAHH